MAFEWIRLYHYRNLRDAEIDLSSQQVFLVGDNGQGKTNLLESIYLLCFGSSFRTRRDSDLIRFGEKEMSVTGLAVPASELDGSSPGAEISIRIQNHKKAITVDGKHVRDRKDLIERHPGIVFCHEDIEFVSGAPERRRWFFNQTMSLNVPIFVDVLRRYTRVVQMRNSAIRSGDFDLLPLFDQQAATSGLEIQRNRAEMVEAFNLIFTNLFSFVSGISDPVSIRYSPSWNGCNTIDSVLESLLHARAADRAVLTSTSGPHRDRFSFIQNGKDYARTASTGQLRLLSLVLRVAQAAHFTKVTRILPILLLDDVLLELDGEKRKRFIEVLPESDQAIFTFLPDERYDRYKRAETTIYEVAAGALDRTQRS